MLFHLVVSTYFPMLVVEGFAFVAEHVVVSRIEAPAALVAVAVLWWIYGPLW